MSTISSCWFIPAAWALIIVCLCNSLYCLHRFLSHILLLLGREFVLVVCIRISFFTAILNKREKQKTYDWFRVDVSLHVWIAADKLFADCYGISSWFIVSEKHETIVLHRAGWDFLSVFHIQQYICLPAYGCWNWSHGSRAAFLLTEPLQHKWIFHLLWFVRLQANQRISPRCDDHIIMAKCCQLV